MTEDRLTQLLTEATDLRPSEALRSRVGPSPQPFSPRGEKDLQRAPWFALSGATAALAVAAFVVIPHPVSAAELIQRANRAVQANLTYRTVYEDYVHGKWRVHTLGLNAPGWQLTTWPSGRFELRKSGVIYARFDLSGPIRMSHHVRTNPNEEALQADPSPENYVRLLRSINPGRDGEFGLTLGRHLEEDGRRLREVVVTESQRFIRTRYIIDETTNLPVRVEQDQNSGLNWRLSSRTTFTFPGPVAGSEPFTRLLRTAPVVDVDKEEAAWTHRLAKVLRVLRPPHGEPLAVRDLRILPGGDVLMLYTGPQRALARLEGLKGEPFALCQSLAWGSLYPDHRHVVRYLHFVPLHADVPVSGPLRLSLQWNGRLNGSFRLDAPLQSATRPPWATAMNASFGDEGQTVREEGRVVALADRWLDAKGHSFSGSFSQDPSSELRTIGMSGLTAPEGAVRPDPEASAEAALVMRRLMTRLAAEGEEEDSYWTSRLLLKLDRRVGGKQR